MGCAEPQTNTIVWQLATPTSLEAHGRGMSAGAVWRDTREERCQWQGHWSEAQVGAERGLSRKLLLVGWTPSCVVACRAEDHQEGLAGSKPLQLAHSGLGPLLCFWLVVRPWVWHSL